MHFNPRSLAGATDDHIRWSPVTGISIHAPSRERRCWRYERTYTAEFQSTLPRGSDSLLWLRQAYASNFNPRSLAGATGLHSGEYVVEDISIHAPSRERLDFYWPSFAHLGISIHAPSRERLVSYRDLSGKSLISIHAPSRERPGIGTCSGAGGGISIHAPSRERPAINNNIRRRTHISIHAPSRERPLSRHSRPAPTKISIHAPSRERPHPLQTAINNLSFQSTLPRGSDLLLAGRLSLN